MSHLTEILDIYDIPDKWKQYLHTWSMPYDFNTIYDICSDWIDMKSTPFIYSISIDSMTPCSIQTLNKVSIEGDEPVTEQKDITEHVTDTIPEIPKGLHPIITQLLPSNIDIVPEEDVEKIVSRIKELTEVYGSPLNLLARPIKGAKFNPLEISWGWRRWKTDPIEFLNDNPVYKDLSRYQLQRFDRGLYDILWKKDLLEEAIPEIRNHLPTTTRKKVRKGYTTYNKKARQTALHLGISTETVLNDWRSKGYEIREHNNLTQSEVQQIIHAHTTYKGVLYKAAKALKRHQKTIMKYWEAANLESTNRTITDAHEQTIKDAYHIYKGVVSQATEHLPYSPPTIRKIWKKNGLKPLLKGRYDTMLETRLKAA